MNRRLVFFVIAVAVLLAGSIAVAQNGEFKIPLHQVAGGGGTSVDGDRFGVSGTIGQAGSGLFSDGATFALRGGYWHAGGSAPETGPDKEKLFLPLLVRPE